MRDSGMAEILPLHTQLQRVFRAELNSAIEAIPSDVHGARKRCKKLRAMLRLLRGPLGDRYSPLNRGIRDAARALSGQRDDDVVAALCNKLHADAPEMAWSTVPAALSPAAADGPRGDDAQAMLADIARQLDEEPLPVITPEDLALGLCNGYRRTRKRWRKAMVDPRDAAPLHEWRKEVKYHMHNCQVLAPLWPALKRQRKELDRLADALGDHHDRFMLEQRLYAVDGGKGSEHPGKLAHLRREQEWLAKRSLRQAERLFALSPSSWWQRQVLRQ